VATRSALLTKYYPGDQIKKNEIGWAHGTHGRCAYRGLVGKLWGNNDLENLGIDGRIKMDLKKIGCGGGGDWIDQAHDTDKWRAFVSVLVNLRAP